MDVEYKKVNVNVNNWKIIFRQAIICTLTSFSSMICGLSIGAPTVIIPQLRKATNSTGASSEDLALESWASSAVSFTGVPWIAILVTSAHIIGRKKSLFFLNFCLILAFLTSYYSANIKQITLSQSMLGISAASVKTLNIMLASEYTSPKCRAIYLTFQSASYFWGISIANSLGTFFHWTTISLFGLTNAVFQFLLVIIIPESPYWLASKHKYDQCAAAHRWLKGVDDDSEKELYVLNNYHRSNNQKLKRVPVCSRLWQHLRSVGKPEVYKRLLCCMLVCGLNDWSGKLSFTVYAIDMIKKITNSERTAYAGMLILDGITVVGMYLASGLTRIMKRKTLLLSASIVSMFFMGVISLYLFLARLTVIVENNYISMALLVCYSVGACCGPLITTNVLYGELVPVHHGAGIVIIAMYTKLTIGVFLKVSPYMFKYLGVDGTFLLHLIGYSIVLFFAYRNVPETKNKTLFEITQHFNQSTKSKQSRELEALKEYDKS